MKWNAEGGNDGSSWTDAFIDLQSALAIAVSGDQVWVSRGQYWPDVFQGDPSRSFRIADGVWLYGGFIGTEQRVDQRDVHAQTTLSGDLAHNDEWETDVFADNCPRLMILEDANVLIDGFALLGVQPGGEAIHVSGGQLLLRNCTIWSMVQITNAEFDASRCDFSSDIANGSCLRLRSGQLHLEHCTFGWPHDLITFLAVESLIDCPGGGQLLMRDCRFRPGVGIGALISGDASATLERCTFRDIDRGDSSAPIVSVSQPAHFVDCLFANLRSIVPVLDMQDGGDLTGCRFERNTTPVAVSSPAQPVAVSECHFVANEGAAIAGRASRIVQNEFRGNGNYGSVIALSGGDAGILQCTFANNRGTCLRLNGPGYEVISSVFANNTSGSPQEGALTLESGSVFVGQCSFVGNVVGGGVRIRGTAGTSQIHNSLFQGNMFQSLDHVRVESPAHATIGGCWIEGMNLSVSGNVSWLAGNREPPITTAHGGRARSGEQTVRTGVLSLVPVDRWDMDGDGNTAELLPLDIDGDAIDYSLGVTVGADQFVDADVDGLPDWWEQEYFGTSTAAAPGADADGDGLTTLEEYESFGSHPNLPPYYVDGTNGDDAWDGRSPSHPSNPSPNEIGPKKTIVAAIEAAEDGNTILVLPGVYEGVQNHSLGGVETATSGARTHVIRSVAGAGSTIIVCPARTPDAPHQPLHALDGFTLRAEAGASITSPGQIAAALPYTTFRDCVCESNAPGRFQLPAINAALSLDGLRYGAGAAPTDEVGSIIQSHCLLGGLLQVDNGIVRGAGAWFEPAYPRPADPPARIQLSPAGTLRVSRSRNATRTVLRCDVAGTGTIAIDAGAQLIVAGEAVIDLSGDGGSGCAAPAPASTPRVLIDGVLTLQDEAVIRNTGVAVRLLQASPGTTIRYNNILAGGDSTGYGGEFFLEVDPDPSSTRRVSVQCNRIVAQGDRYLDLDPDFTIPPERRPLIQNNRIEVVCNEAVGTQGTILELRSYDHGCDPDQPPSATNCANGPERANLIPWATPDQFDSDTYPANNWVLEKLTVAAGKLLTLTNRQGFDFNGPGHPDCLYVKTLVLEPGAVLNLGGQRLYYGTLLGNVSQVIDTPLLGFSLSNIAMESDNEFSVRVRTRTIDPLDAQPATPPLIEGVAERTALPGHGGVMRMGTRASGAPSSAGSVAAKGHFTRASNLEQIVVDFEYQFTQASPDAVMRVYLSDKAEIGESNRLLAEVRPPPPGFPGSIGSNTFATFRGRFPTNQLNFPRGTFVEVELRGADTQVLIDNLDPQVECTHGCRDFNSENTPTKADLLILLAESGQLRTSRTMCLDGNGDGFIDHLDALFWYSQVPCLNGPHPYGGRNAVVPPQKTNQSPASGPQIVVLGKDNDQSDLLVSVDASTGLCASTQMVPCSGEDCDTRAMGLVQHASGTTYVIHAMNGIYDAQAGPGSPLLANGMVPCSTGECAGVDVGTLLPVTDVAFPPGASAADRLYVAPVTVTPAMGGSTFTAVAEISLTGGTASVTRILGANPYDPATQVLDPCLNCTAAQGTCDPICNLQKVREIDVDPWGNLFALVSDASNANSWLVVYNGAAGTPGHVVFRERIATITGNAIPAAPAALRVSQNHPFAYVTSALTSSRTQTVARLAIARSGATQQVTGVTLDAVRSITIDIGPEDASCANCRYVAHAVAIDENRATGDMYLAGYLGPQYPPDDVTRFTNSTPFFTWPYVITFGAGGSWSNIATSVVGLANCADPTLVWPVAAMFDQTTAIGPPPSVTSWRSVRRHNGVELGIELNPTRTGNGASGPTVEPRSGGIQKLVIGLSGPVSLVDAGAISVTGRTSINGDPQPAVSYASVATLATPTSLELTFPESLPDQTCYTISLAGALRGADGQALTGDTDCLVRSLFGDVNGDGQLVLGDALLIKSRLNWPVTESPICDVNLSGGPISLGDCIVVRSALRSPVPRVACP